MIASTSVDRVMFNFKENEVSILDEVMALPEVRRAKPFSEQEDYILLNFWDTRPRHALAKIMKRGLKSLRDRVTYLRSINEQKGT